MLLPWPDRPVFCNTSAHFQELQVFQTGSSFAGECMYDFCTSNLPSRAFHARNNAMRHPMTGSQPLERAARRCPAASKTKLPGAAEALVLVPKLPSNVCQGYAKDTLPSPRNAAYWSRPQRSAAASVYRLRSWDDGVVSSKSEEVDTGTAASATLSARQGLGTN
ncbi:hypothetical protein MPH_06653 [Macrophomina phaseolina MS6]|uniref:Uncharacterized protein n=1 Tax=Macrophomina phaseolina (strain MS6) TaxID=1126212 RepID=K2R1W1_MACPH|nr:hypothetical protein MPH_06653 [Macrophomina phaseolina MS6]